MCGIWALMLKKGETLSSIGLNENDMYNAFDSIKHRGPDSSNYTSYHNLGLYTGFHRLAIMDKSINGNQPFISKQDNNTIILLVNGEIYNYNELKQNYGLKTISSSDCEVVIELYKLVGFDKTVQMLKGEFAICLFHVNNDNNNIVMHLARDQCGIRPLYISGNEKYVMISSELKGIMSSNNVRQFEPRTICNISNNENNMYDSSLSVSKWFSFKNSELIINDLETAKESIRNIFEQSILSMINSDAECGCLLSGGLDSSLVSALISKYYKTAGKKLRTFSIGMSGSTDKYYAELVAKHIDSNHTHVEFPNDVWINAVNTVVKVIESFDTTSVRASVGQYLISKYIRENTNIKVLFIGDGSDELTGGYLYFKNAPNKLEYNEEIIRLLSDIHKFDVIRADRCIAYNGLEARVPFLHKDFIKMWMSIKTEFRMPRDGIEKWLLRQAFMGTDILPDSVLTRQKEAFSDGVSSCENSWYSILQEHINKEIDDNMIEFAEYDFKYMTRRGAYAKHMVPKTKEEYYIRKIFVEHFGNNINTAKLVPYFWLPKWCGDVKDPSARVLNIYNKLHIDTSISSNEQL